MEPANLDRKSDAPLSGAASVVQAPRPSPWLASLFPPGVIGVEMHGPGDVAWLPPQERACITRAAPNRAAEFAAGRLCARRAMMQLGVADFPVIAGTDRAPQWPDALVGSITHTKGYTAAVVAERRHFHGLGVDVETIDRVTPELWPQICTPGELALLDRLPRPQRARMGALVFSAKEAFYKCQYAVTRQWVGFSDVAIECAALQAGSGAFVVRPLKPLLIAVDSGAQQDFQLAGRFRTDGALVFTGIAIPFAQLTRESSSGEPELR